MACSIEGFPEGWGGRPLQIDIGCHRGTFLAAMAQGLPETDFLGIERLSARVERSNAKFARLGLANARALRAGGLEAVKELPAGCAAGIHVLFPDPWPKRRHAPRRMVTHEFVAACARVLVPGGFLRVATDDAPYAEAIRATVAADREFVLGGEIPEFPPTEFEQKFNAAGKPHSVVFALRAAAAE